MSGISLDPAVLTLVVEKAILDSITPESRDELVQSAIKHLLTEQAKSQSYPYGSGKSPLQRAFEEAVHSAAHTAVKEMIIEDPVVSAKIKELVSEQITILCEGNYNGLPEAIGDAIGNWLRDREMARH